MLQRVCVALYVRNKDMCVAASMAVLGKCVRRSVRGCKKEREKYVCCSVCEMVASSYVST